MGCRPTMKIECAYGKSKAETKGYCLSKLRYCLSKSTGSAEGSLESGGSMLCEIS